MEIKIINQSLHPLPAYETAHAAGMDIRAFTINAIVIKPLQRILIPTGLQIELPVKFHNIVDDISSPSGFSLEA